MNQNTYSYQKRSFFFFAIFFYFFTVIPALTSAQCPFVQGTTFKSSSNRLVLPEGQTHGVKNGDVRNVASLVLSNSVGLYISGELTVNGDLVLGRNAYLNVCSKGRLQVMGSVVLGNQSNVEINPGAVAVVNGNISGQQGNILVNNNGGLFIYGKLDIKKPIVGEGETVIGADRPSICDETSVGTHAVWDSAICGDLRIAIENASQFRTYYVYVDGVLVKKQMSTERFFEIPVGLLAAGRHAIKVTSDVGGNCYKVIRDGDVNIETLLGKPLRPVSQTLVVCAGSAGTSVSLAEETIGAASYLWRINPVEAGIVDGSTTAATIRWNPSFTGRAGVLVNAVNGCGYSPNSDVLQLTVKSCVPLQPEQPVTDVNPVCQGTSSTKVSILNDANGAEPNSYVWRINPANAGTIKGNTKSATITWNPTFSGTAYIIVNAQNSSGSSPNSDQLAITVKSCKPEQPERPVASSKSLCFGVKSTRVRLINDPEGAYADRYLWRLAPSNAGVVDGTGKEATITWSPTFSGSVQVFVNAFGSGGFSDNSPSLVISIIKVNGGKIGTLDGATACFTGVPLEIVSKADAVAIPAAPIKYSWQMRLLGSDDDHVVDTNDSSYMLSSMDIGSQKALRLTVVRVAAAAECSEMSNPVTIIRTPITGATYHVGNSVAK